MYSYHVGYLKVRKIKKNPKPLDISPKTYYNIPVIQNAVTGHCASKSFKRAVGRCDTVG